jgi:hypothetical protein
MVMAAQPTHVFGSYCSRLHYYQEGASELVFAYESEKEKGIETCSQQHQAPFLPLVELMLADCQSRFCPSKQYCVKTSEDFSQHASHESQLYKVVARRMRGLSEASVEEEKPRAAE